MNAGLSNKGNRALIISTIKAIQEFIPDTSFSMVGAQEIQISNLTIKKQICCGLGNPYSFVVTCYYLLFSTFIYLFRHLKIDISVSKKSRLFPYHTCDLVINSGGDQLSGEYGFSTLCSFINIICPLLLDKPVILYGESLGYFNNKILNTVAKIVMNKTKLIIVREDISAKYINDNHINNPSLYITADPAFLLDAATESRVFEIISKEEKLSIKKPLIGINPSGLITEFSTNKHNSEEDFSNTLAKVIDYIIENFKAQIIMIPHVYTHGADDRVSIDQIFSKIKNQDKVGIIKNEYTPQELKGIIGQCDLFVGARMHATIAATSMFVPTVGIAYSHKMHGIIGQMLKQDKYILNINDLTYDSLISKINDVWTNRIEIENELRARIPEVKNKALSNGKIVKNFLDSI
jgi:polysaccharide pyruvyl transferase WcaK-like protein